MNVIDNSKNFKILELSSHELISTGGFSICDCCNTFMEKGYFVAVLHMTYCEKDYHLWLEKAVNYTEDQPFENFSFKRMKDFITKKTIKPDPN